MDNESLRPSLNGISFSGHVKLRPTKKEVKEPETKVSTEKPAPSTPSPRGHA